MKNLMSVEKAISLALNAHSGQLDLDGKPEILHPLRVGAKGETEDEIIVGILHDVVEDTPTTIEDLIKEGLSSAQAETLRLLTHTKDKSYKEYIDDIVSSHNKVAIKVKYNDLTDNIERGINGNHEKQVLKHTKALMTIKQSI